MNRISRSGMLLGVAVAAFVATSSTNEAATLVQYTIVPAPSAVPAPPSAVLAPSDAAFINSAATSGTEEVSFAQLAQTNSNNPAVLRFAGEMVRDHTLANQQLTKLAETKAMGVPSAMDAPHQALYGQLGSSNGSAFDQVYVNGQVQDHVLAVQLFQMEAQSGVDPDLRGFAQHYLPMMQQHLQMAQALAQTE
jgi:putative membrane protein